MAHEQIKAAVGYLLSPLSVFCHQSVPLGLGGSNDIELLEQDRLVLLCDDCELEIFVGNVLACNGVLPQVSSRCSKNRVQLCYWDAVKSCNFIQTVLTVVISCRICERVRLLASVRL